MKRTVRLFVAATGVFFLVGCMPSSFCVKPVVHLQDPVLPKISTDEVNCLSKETWEKLGHRDIILQSRLRECRAAVKELTEQP
jgi:hypothetical protein